MQQQTEAFVEHVEATGRNCETLFTPDTILRWHRKLVAAKYDYSDRRQKIGRPKLSEEIVQLALRMAKENPTF